MQGVTDGFRDQNSVLKKALYTNKAAKIRFIRIKSLLGRGGEDQTDLSPRSHTDFVVAPVPPKPRR